MGVRRQVFEIADVCRPGREVYYPPDTLLPWVHTVGWNRTRRAKSGVLAAHAHPGHWEITWLVQGTLDWWVGDERHRLRPGSLFLTRPDERHGACHNALEPCEQFWIQLADPAPPDAPELASLLPVLRRAPRLRPGDPGLAGPWRAILAELAQPDAWSVLAVRGSLGVLCAQLARCWASTVATPRTPSPALRRAMAWVEEQATWIHPVAALAREAGLSSARLQARFTAEIGLSPADWMRRRRLEAAQHLLATTRQEIVAIAHQLGFRSSQHFATQFRLSVGVPPQRWRAIQSMAGG